MKKFLFLSVLIGAAATSHGQYSPHYDTIRKNEISVNVLPVIAVLAGYSPESRTASFSVGYRHYFKNRYVLRASLAFKPSHYINDAGFMDRYVRTVDTLNVFKSYTVQENTQLQLSLGLEKIFRVKRFMHGYGAELLLAYNSTNYDLNGYWFPKSMSLESGDRWNYYSHDKSLIGTTYNGVDSISYAYKAVSKGIGLRPFYSLRYKINRYLYISSTFGPCITASVVSYHDQKGKMPFGMSGNSVNLDFTLLISDVSIAFRF